MTNLVCNVARALIAVVLAVTLTVHAAVAGDVDRGRLKKAAPLPSVEVRFGWRVSPAGWEAWRDPAAEPGADAVAVARAKIDRYPGNADLWLQLASAQGGRGDADGAEASVARAVALAVARAKEHADDGAALARLSRALAADADDVGAADAARRASCAATAPWEGWSAQADLLAARGVGLIAGTRFRLVDDAYVWVQPANPPETIPEPAVKLLDEAASCHDQAVAAADAAVGRMKTADVRSVGSGPSWRSHLLLRRAHLLMFRLFLGQRLPGSAAAAQATFGRALADYRRAADLDLDDPDAAAFGALVETMSGLFPSAGAGAQTWDALPEERRTRISAMLTRLAGFATSADPAVASRALVGTAVIQLMVQRDARRAETSLRAALAKDPTSDPCFELLAGMLIGGERWEDLTKLCTEWVKQGDSARKRMILAKAEDRCGRADATEKAWRAALALDPAGFETNLGLAVLVLRRQGAGADPSEPDALVRTAGEAFVAMTRPSRDQKIYGNVAHAWIAAMTGDPDAAEKSARLVLAADSGNSCANEVLAAIGR